MYGVIYKITNLIDGKNYVGQTINFNQRIGQHKRGKQFIDKAIQKYGWKNFTVEIVEECTSLEQLNKREIFWIAAFNSKVPNGYNLTDGGDGIFGCSDETRAKLAAASTGHEVSEESRRKIGLASKNRRPNEETRAKMSAAHAGKRPGEETRAKMSVSQKGHTLPLKSCAKISAAKRKGNIFKNLLTAMDERQLTYASLAKFLGLSTASVSAKMRGMRNFTAKDVDKLVEFFGLAEEYLMSK